MDGEKQRFMFRLSFILFIDCYLMYVHINFSLVHTSFHSCSLCFLHSHIQTNKIAGENDGVLTAVVEEEIQRCMLVLLFHIHCFVFHLLSVCVFT
jgi:hypothetical protein